VKISKDLPDRSGVIRREVTWQCRSPEPLFSPPPPADAVSDLEGTCKYKLLKLKPGDNRAQTREEILVESSATVYYAFSLLLPLLNQHRDLNQQTMEMVEPNHKTTPRHLTISVANVTITEL
jgi:hypothetical protein